MRKTGSTLIAVAMLAVAGCDKLDTLAMYVNVGDVVVVTRIPPRAAKPWYPENRENPHEPLSARWEP